MIFVIRNIDNLVPPCEPDAETSFHGTSAAIEFGVNALKVKHIVVLGHASCGGVAAYASNAAPLTKRDFIGKWMSQIKPVAERVGRSEEHTSELQSLMRISYAVFCLKKKKTKKRKLTHTHI